MDSYERKKQQCQAEIRYIKDEEAEDRRHYQRQKSTFFLFLILYPSINFFPPDIKQMREKRFQQQNKDAYRAYMWVRNNRKLFNGLFFFPSFLYSFSFLLFPSPFLPLILLLLEELLGPLSLEIDVECEEHALYVEKALGKSMTAFVAQNEVSLPFSTFLFSM